MKAVVFYEHGGVEKLKYEDVLEPEASGTEVVVRVRACALNHLDIWVREGLAGVPLPHISGSDISGEVHRVGRLVKNVAQGQRVVVAPGISCGSCEYCLSGNDGLCPQYKIIGYQVDGGYAEYVKVPSDNIIPLPQGMGFEEAAAVPLVFLTAWHMLVTRAHVKLGEDVLIWAAGSGLGSAAVQIAKLWGARVIATAGTDWKLERARALGADEAINHRSNEVAVEVKRLTNEKGVDVVIDHVGMATWPTSLKSLARGGRMVSCGATTGNVSQVEIRPFYMKQLSLLGSYVGSKAELIEVLKFFERGKLRPVIDRVMPLHQAREAQLRMEKSEHFGKIVLKPG